MTIDNYFKINVGHSGYLKTEYSKYVDFYYEETIEMLKNLSKDYNKIMLNNKLEEDKLYVGVMYKNKENSSIDEKLEETIVKKDVVKLKREFNSIYGKEHIEKEAIHIIKVNQNEIMEVLRNVFLSLKSSKGLTSVGTRLSYTKRHIENDVKEVCRVFVEIRNAEDRINSEIDLPIVALELNVHMFSLLNKLISNIINNRYIIT